MYAAIFISVFVAAWVLLSFVPWLVLSVATRGNAGLANLPLCLFSGVVAGLAVPLLGHDDITGIWLSMVAALFAPSLLLAARRFSFGSSESTQPNPARPE